MIEHPTATKTMDFSRAIADHALILAECAIAERLRRLPHIELHPTLFNAPLIYDRHAEPHLRAIYREYRRIALAARLPLLLCAPTWRADRERVRAAGFTDTFLSDCVAYLQGLQRQWQDDAAPLFAGALVAPKNDCYRPESALARREARDFHRWQVERLAAAGPDVIIAQTIPALSEALGLADVFGETDVPAVISFVINRHGAVLDGTDLLEAIETIDHECSRPPLGYMVNCVYPSFLDARRRPPRLFRRLLGIQANSSAKDHEELDGAASLERDPLADWLQGMTALNREFGVRILGGCCGTDGRYLGALADALGGNGTGENLSP